MSEPCTLCAGSRRVVLSAQDHRREAADEQQRCSADQQHVRQPVLTYS